MRDRNWLDIVKGKSVCLVGNSVSMMGKSLGTIVDSHDVVVRFNKWNTFQIEIDSGIKTTVWAVSTHHFRYHKEFHPWFNTAWDHLGKIYDIAPKDWTLDDYKESPLFNSDSIWRIKKTFEPHKIKEFWLVPSIVNPTTLLTDEDLSSVPKDIPIKEAHCEAFTRQNWMKLNKGVPHNKKRHFTTGCRILHGLIRNRKHLKDLSVIGFGSNKKEEFIQNHRQVVQHSRRPADDNMESVAKFIGTIHDFQFEQDLLIDWINQGLVRRLEEEKL